MEILTSSSRDSSDNNKLYSDSLGGTSVEDFSSEENEFAIQILKGLDDSCSVKSESSVSLIDSIAPDTRNTITKAFENCLNSGDAECVRQVLTPVLDENCVVESYALKQIGLVGSEQLENCVSGKEQVIPYFMGFVTTIPDIIFLVHEWKLFARGGGNSCLMFKFTLSGNQIVPHETKCKIEEEDDVQELMDQELKDDASLTNSDTDNLSGQKRDHAETTITFKATSTYQVRQQDHKKNKKKKTLGEFITHNRVKDAHVVDVETMVQDLRTLENIVAKKPETENGHQNQPSLEELGLLQDAIKINMRGVMRFHFNERNQIYKIHCVHFVSHEKAQVKVKK